MKDDILTAVTTDFNVPPNKVPNVAPIAPLPSRLSFCLSPQRQQQLDSMLASGGSTSSATAPTSTPSISAQPAPSSATSASQKTALTAATVPPGGCTSVVIENDLEELEAAEDVIISPTKKLLTTSSTVDSAPASSGK